MTTTPTSAAPTVAPLSYGPVSRQCSVAVHAFDAAITAAIHAAAEADVPQGLIAGLMHAHALRQTLRIVEE